MQYPRPLLQLAEVVTVGLPFCVFKLLTGLIAIETVLAPVGYVLLALGTADVVLNLLNFGALLVARRRVGAVCVADLALRKYRARGLGLAVDVFVSFALVAVVVGAGLIARVPAWALPLWNFSVVLNVLGAGVGRLASALR